MSDDPTGSDPAIEAADPGTAIDALTEEILPALIARLRSSRLAEIEVAKDGWRVRLRRDGSSSRRSASISTADGAASAESITAETNGSGARSPAVGYFIPAPNLAIGHSVRAGDSIGGVDVLGVTQDVSAPGDGIIGRVLAEAGQAVEYGQVLASIDPLDADLEAEANRDGPVVD